MYYDFANPYNSTSGSYTICRAADLLIGGLLPDDTAPAAAIFNPDVSDDLIITLNGTTTGGEIGTAFLAYSPSRWMVLKVYLLPMVLWLLRSLNL